MKRMLVAAMAMAVAGCWTFNETEFPATAVSAAQPGVGSVQLAGFETLLTEWESVHGFQTVYVPGYYGRHHRYPGHYETLPVVTMVPQQRSSDMFLQRAQDAIEKAGYTLTQVNPEYLVEVRFSGPYTTNGDTWKELGWNFLSAFLCDYGTASWTAALRIRHAKTGKLLFAHDYEQKYEVNVIGLLPLFSIAASDACDRAKMQCWCLAALTDRALADATAFLSSGEKTDAEH